MTAADFENTNAIVCRASPSCPIGVSSATINGENYCHNCHQAINTYEDGYMHCFVANSHSRLFLRSAIPPCDNLPNDVPALLAPFRSHVQGGYLPTPCSIGVHRGLDLLQQLSARHALR